MARTYVTTNAHSLAIKMIARSEAYVKEIEEANRENAELVLAKARQFSQTQYFTLGELKAMGHPYARRVNAPPIRPHIINRHTSDFYNSFAMQQKKTADGAEAVVFNKSRHAKYMMSTKWMIERPVLDEALDRTKVQRQRNMNAARMRGLRRVRSAG